VIENLAPLYAFIVQQFNSNQKESANKMLSFMLM